MRGKPLSYLEKPLSKSFVHLGNVLLHKQKYIQFELNQSDHSFNT